MTKQIRKIFKLIACSYGSKMNLCLWGALFAVGILLQFVGKSSWSGSYLLLATALCPAQMIYSLSASHMIQASAEKKKLQTTVPAIVIGAYNILIYLVLIIIKFIQIKAEIHTPQEVSFEFLMDSGLIFVIAVYNGIAYKTYYLSTFVFFVVICVYGALLGIEAAIGVFAEIPLAAAVCLGFLAIAAGGILQYGISRLVYKRPVDKNAQMSGLRKAM